ncbi:MAG: hypothetical protein ACRED0_10120 [Gammaproteobacteria bacterium]
MSPNKALEPTLTPLGAAAGVLHFEAGLVVVFPALIAVSGLVLWWVGRRYRSD